ncbi:MAG: hypothetical protein ACYC7E_08135 [Armatimonadota bacterium]
MTTQITTATEERAYLRELARQVAEIAAGPENARIKQRWRDVNALRKPDRSPVWCRPVGAWSEILPVDALRCTDPWLRGVENGFRQTLIKHEIGDDSPVDGVFDVSARFDCDPPNVWGVDVGRHTSSAEGGAWSYDPPLKSEVDFARLRIPRFTYNDAATQQALAQADELLGDILPVRRICGPQLGATLGGPAADLRGLTEMMMDTLAEPELMHRLMAYLRDCTLENMRQVAATGLLTANNAGPMFCSDPLGEPVDGKFAYANLWGAANSQEFDQISPAMWEEFCLQYQMPILEQFGYTAYGCCENLTHKIDGVLSIPNLRIFVCSAWTDLDRVIERVGTNYTIMWRQKASAVVFPDDHAELQRDLDDGLRRLQGCYVQVVLRELQTLAGHPDRLHVWTRLAIEAAEKYA